MVIFHSYVSLPEGTHGKKPICVQLFEGIAWKRCHNLTYVKLTDYPKKGTSEIDLRFFFSAKADMDMGLGVRKSTAIQNILNLTSLKCLTHARHQSLSPPLDIQPLQEGDKERDRDDDQDHFE